jgi:hypothetical protein
MPGTLLSRWRGGRYRVACLQLQPARNRLAWLHDREEHIKCEPQGGSHDYTTTADGGGTPAPQLFTRDNSRLHPRRKTVRGVFR